MNYTKTQYILTTIIIILISYHVYNNSNQMLREKDINNNLDQELDNLEDENIEPTSKSYNYNNNNTVLIKNDINMNDNINDNIDDNYNNIILENNEVYIDTKIILSGNNIKNVYTKATIQPNLKSVLLYYLKKIISKIINITSFNLNDIERVYEEIDSNNNRRYVIIFFIYNLNYFNSNKLLIDFVINFDNEFIYLNNLKDFYNSYPNIINNYDDIIFNRAYLKNSTQEDDLNEILKEDYLKNYKYAYLSDTSLDFTNIYLNKSSKSLKDLSTIFLPNTQVRLTENIFCDKYTNGTWDKNGNLIKNNQDCILHNSSTTQNIDVPDKYPYFGSDKEIDYYWLIDPLRNNIIRQEGYVI